MEHRCIDSPVAPLTLVAEGSALVALYMADQAHLPPTAELGDRNDEAGQPAADQLAQYFAGDRTAFDLDLAPRGTAFQQRVWDALRSIPFGHVDTYGGLARRLEMAGAARAVGSAIARNPIGIIVPCHRVIGANGVLTGFAAGLPRKRFLLELEGSLPAAV